MQYCTMKIGLKDVTDEGITIKSADISQFSKGPGEMICFTLRAPAREDLNTISFRGRLFLIDLRKDNYFECIAMEFSKCQS